MDSLVAGLALVVALEYAVIAVAVVPRLARLAVRRGRMISLARWGAAAFFLGCALTHVLIAVAAWRQGDSLDRASLHSLAHGGSGLAPLWEQVLPHLAQVVGGAVFIGVSHRRLALSIMTKSDAAELRELEAHLHTAFDRAPVGVALVRVHGGEAPGGCIEKVNPALRRLVGEDEGSLHGRPYRDTLVHPGDRERSRSALTQLLAGPGSDVELELRFLHRQGHEVWVHVAASLTRDGAGEPLHAVLQVRDITDDRRREAQLRHLAERDGLTGVLNRRRFGEELDRIVATAHRYRQSAALLVVDLDQFKFVNDTYGHAVGDQLLCRVAAVLGGRLRTTDVLGRLGGDEFALVLPHTEEAGATALADDLLRALREDASVDVLGRSVQAAASIGVTMIDGAAETTAEQLLAEADIAMYEAKETGRDRVVTASGAAHGTARMRARLTWSQRVRDALADDGFVLWEQPILNLATDRIDRSELLLRMVDPVDGSLVTPAHFLPVAERFGQVQAIDSWVFSQAIALLEERHARGDTNSVEINLSGASLTDEELVDDITRQLRSASFDTSRLIVEVTETAAVGNVQIARTLAARLADAGCRFALDDFGSGFGSFFYLKHLHFDGVKIDGEFIKDLPASRTDLLTLDAIVMIARGLDKEVTAEFVQNEATLDLLRERGVGFAQGYHVGRPRPVEDVTAAFRRPVLGPLAATAARSDRV